MEGVQLHPTRTSSHEDFRRWQRSMFFLRLVLRLPQLWLARDMSCIRKDDKDGVGGTYLLELAIGNICCWASCPRNLYGRLRRGRRFAIFDLLLQPRRRRSSGFALETE